MKVKGFMWLAVFLVLGIIALSNPAYAVPLNTWNVTELNNGGDSVNVTVGTNASGNTTLSVQWVEASTLDGVPTAIGIDQFGFNTTTSVSVLTCPTGWNCNLGTQNMDGFGSFLEFQQGPGATDGISSPLVFVLNGSVTFANNGSPHFATYAAHVRYGGDCSGFVSDGTTTSISSNRNCDTVPEPTTLLLMGSGLLGLGLLGRRRFKARS